MLPGYSPEALLFLKAIPAKGLLDHQSACHQGMLTAQAI